jgi:hypothetical protein
MGVKNMRLIKLFGISVLVFFVMLTLIGLLFPSTVQTVKAVVVNKPQQQVKAALAINNTWLKWYPYFNPEIVADIHAADADTTIFFNDKKELQLYNKRSDSNAVYFTIKAWNGVEVNESILALPISGDSTQTQVVWNETEHLKWYPWERFRGLLLEGSKGIFLDTALNRFKVYIEAQQ